MEKNKRKPEVIKALIKVANDFVERYGFLDDKLGQELVNSISESPETAFKGNSCPMDERYREYILKNSYDIEMWKKAIEKKPERLKYITTDFYDEDRKDDLESLKQIAKDSFAQGIIKSSKRVYKVFKGISDNEKVENPKGEAINATQTVLMDAEISIIEFKLNQEDSDDSK